MKGSSEIATEKTTIVLARRPKGMPVPEDFRIEKRAIRPLKPGEMLLRTLWLSLDPYMRPRMDDRESYATPVAIGGCMVGQSVAQVIASQSSKFAVGDIVTAYTGWQSHYVIAENAERLYKVNANGLPLSVFLGPAGMPGRTGYLGLTRVGKPQKGDTVVVSAAAGAVGSVVGQVAKYLGCYVVGIAGGQDKCDYVKNVLGFDDCIDYKSGNLAEKLKASCPKGIDIYFENVGGDVIRAVAPLLNTGARVPICGFVSAYNNLDNTETPFDVLGALPEPPEHRFFLVSEWNDEYQQVTATLANWVREGKIKYRETIAEGLENAPAAFIGMLQGKNIGKQLVKVAAP